MRRTAKSSFFTFLFLMLWVNLLAQNGNVVEYRDLSYMDAKAGQIDSLRMLNLVLPKSGNDYPLLIWIGGGAWSYVDRNQEMAIARQLAEEGIAVASIGHRLSPATWVNPALNTGIQHPQHIIDLADAVNWLYEKAAQYGYSRKKLFIGGYSSGAHLAALICMDQSYLEAKGLSADIFKGVIPVSGTYDIPDYYATLSNSGNPELGDLHVKAVFGKTQEDFIKASPTTYLDNLSTPMLLMSDDNMFNYTKLFENKVRKIKHEDFEVVYARSMSHSELWRDLSNSSTSIYREKIIAFINNRSKLN